MATREQNERQFDQWEDLPGGGRKYWRQRPGGHFGSQMMVRVVDENEVAIRAVQEVYDDEGVMIEQHVKYPEDRGHPYL